jgi:putative ABC transport system permease protein
MRRPLAVAVPLAAFRTLALLMPGRFRDEWLSDAERDLERTLETLRATRGSGAAWWAGTRAALDVLARIPWEWWRVRRRRARRGGPGAGERIMSWWMELRQSARALLRRPGYASAAILTLALGIGATVTIFGVVNAVLIRPLPFPEADRIVSVRHHAPALDLPELESSEGMLNFYGAQASVFGALGAYDSQQRNLIGGPTPERVELAAVTPQIFDVLRVQPATGRPFNPDDVREGASPVALLTDAAWRTRFGSDPQVVGRTIRLDDVVTEIVGVMPPGFAFPDPDAVALVPLRIDPEGRFGTFGMHALGRIADEFTLDQAASRLRELQARLPEFFPDITADFLDRAGWGVSVDRYQDRVVGEDVASALWLVFGTVGLVLVIACANVANLFLVRAEARQKELAVRAAMGAGLARIASGFLSEALVLGLVGGVIGAVLAWSGIVLLVANGPSAIPRLHEVRMDGATLAFAASLSVLIALVLGAVPLLRPRGRGPASALRFGGRAATHGRDRQRTRNVLVAGQLALALVLLVGSGLMLRSFHKLRTVDPGFDGDRVTAVGMSLGEGVDNAAAARFYAEVAERVAALPGVETVGLTGLVPLGEGSANGGSFYVEGVERGEDELPPVSMYKVISEGYLETIHQPLLEGRALTRADWQPGAEPVLLVNAAFRDRLLGGDAIGKGIRWDEEGTFAHVVGVVADARERNIREDQGPWAYLPMRVADWGYPNLDRSYLVVRGAPGLAVPVGAIRDVVTRLDPSVPITSVRTMHEVMARALAGTAFTMSLLGIAAAVALFLGAIGLFGVISYVVGQRTREIGVRVALGARGRDIRALVLQQGTTVAVAGVVLGLAGAAAVTRVMRSLLFDVSTGDPVSFVAAPVLLMIVAATATWLPARRASRVDPVVALRAE